jgi:hypothetical protein
MFNQKDFPPIPFLVLIVIGSTLMACIGGWTLGGYNASGYAWMIPVFFSFFVVLYRLKRMTFAFYLWLPWIIYITVSFVLTCASDALQRTFMMVCPFWLGTAVSCYHVTDQQLRYFRRLMQYLGVLLLAIIVFRSGMLVTGNLPIFGVSAPIAMTGSLLASFFAASYVFNAKRALFYWLIIQVMSIIAFVRTPMLATAITLPCTLSPMNYKTRTWIAIAVAIGGLLLFYTPRMQERMFYSSEGRLADLSYESRELRDAGRRFIWDVMRREISKRRWSGYGSNASENLVLSITGYSLTHPHNDWLRLLYDYGYIGTGIFIICISAQMIHAFFMARKSSGESRVLFYACASSFIPFSLIMFTDNIILYVAFFGNLQFTMLGLAYAAQKTQEIDNQHYFRVMGMRPPVNPSQKATGKNGHGSNHFPGGRWK